MANVEEITLEDQVFRVFKRIPVPITRQLQKMMLEMAEDFEGSFEDLETGKVSPKDAKNINLDILFEMYDLLLTTVVITPKINKEDILKIDHELQPYFQDLGDLLFEKFTESKIMIKKKSPN